MTRAIRGPKGETTLTAIGHRLPTIGSCDALLLLRGGEMVGTGTYRELAARDPDFARASAPAAEVGSGGAEP